jgi:hypothetical protein
MLHAWSKTTMDSRRAISLLLAVGGITVAALGMAASPDLPPIGISTVGPVVLGAVVGGYVRHRLTDRERAPLWALAYGAGATAAIVATFGTAVLIRPTVRDISDLRDVWSGLIVGGFLVSFVGALLWERDARVRRFAAPALLGLWLVVSGVFASMSGDPWTTVAAPAVLGGFGLFLVAFVVGRPGVDQNGITPAI